MTSESLMHSNNKNDRVSLLYKWKPSVELFTTYHHFGTVTIALPSSCRYFSLDWLIHSISFARRTSRWWFQAIGLFAAVTIPKICSFELDFDLLMLLWKCQCWLDEIDIGSTELLRGSFLSARLHSIMALLASGSVLGSSTVLASGTVLPSSSLFPSRSIPIPFPGE